MSYASTSIDRRAAYYVRSAILIAADPLDFYTRAERGRKFQTTQFGPRTIKPAEIVSQYLNDVRRKITFPLQGQVALMSAREPALIAS
jgi:hypothetical protein